MVPWEAIRFPTPLAVYVEIFIRGSLEELWRLTQTPQLQERWDLRFSSISSLERPEGSNQQRLRYATRLGSGVELRPGLRVEQPWLHDSRRFCPLEV